MTSPGTTSPLIFGTGTVWFKDPNADATEIHRPTVEGIKAAIELGYRNLDGAQMYNTEREIGLAMKESGVPRSEISLTTKTMGLDDIEESLEASLAKLQTEYVDTCLIHSPFAATSPGHLQDAWRSMERCLERGLAKKIGVSNFSAQNLQTILATARVPPAVNQVEMHPYLYQPELYAFLKTNNIALQGFASLTPLRQDAPNRTRETCQRLAAAYGVSEQTVLLRWVIDQGAAVITTSSRSERLAAVLKEVPSFQLKEDEVRQITESGEGKRLRGFFAEEFSAEEEA